MEETKEKPFGGGQEKELEEEEEEEEAKVNMWKYIFGFVEMAVVKCAIELGIADAIESHGSPMTLSQLSSTLSCSPSYLYRIMRFLTHRNIFKEKPASQGGPAYAQTPLSRRFMRKGEHSMAAFLLLESSPAMLSPWHGLSTRILPDGVPSFKKAHGEDVWSYAATNPEHSRLIDEAMACNTRFGIPAIVQGCPEVFEGIGTLVDVGGGNGVALCTLVKAFPWIKGLNFDLPHVISNAPLIEGVEHVKGDMFKCVPKADAVFIKWVLHDWGDEECIQILKKCREAIPNDKGKVIIVEAVIEEWKKDRLNDVGLMLDMVMLAHTDYGKERTLNEWEYVITEAGFTRFLVKPIRAVHSVIVAYP